MKKAFFILTVASALVAQAGLIDRPAGIRIGQRMTIRPYVSLYYTWDSNVDSSTSQGSDHSFNISPGLTFSYKADNWSVEGSAFYQYHAYNRNESNLNQHSWGESLAFDWTNSKDGSRGWSFALRENLQMISQDDDMTNDGGRGIGRDRWQLQLAATLQRRFTDRWHGALDVSYYIIDYKNDQTSYAPLYGWKRLTLGAQAGYVASRWTDIQIMGNYQGYTQDNSSDLGVSDYTVDERGTRRGNQIGKNSQGYTVHLGVGTYATKKISYQLSGGYSYFKYGDGASDCGGFTYSASAHWRMTDTWNMMLLASSYYSPSETDYGSATRTDSVSWGLAHSMIRNKLTATLDLTYRHQRREYVEYQSSDVADDVITARLGLNYMLNRFISIFGNCEYQTSFSNGDYLEQHNYTYDYDRWRLSIGLRLTY